jgi:hypothetical protein
VGYKFIGFLEGAVVEQKVDALACRQLPLRVLPFAPFPAAAFFCQPAAPRKLVHSAIFHRVGL